MAEYQSPEEPEPQETVVEEPVDPPPFRLSEQQFTSFKESVAAYNVNMPNRRVFCPLDGAIFP